MLGFPLGILSAAGAGGVAAGSYELISTTILGSAQSSVVFDVSSLASTYKHLQVRYAARHSAAETGIFTKLNTNTSYAAHYVLGTGSSVISGAFTNTTRAQAGLITGSDAVANWFGPGVIDLLDPFSTTKNKTTRGLSASNFAVILMSGLSMSTEAVTSWELTPSGANFVAGSRFSLYGIKG